MSRKVERKTQHEFVYTGFGFPVDLVEVPMIRVRGAWTPDVDYDALAKVVLRALVAKPARLSGNEVRFIRHSFPMTLTAFAERFNVTHPAVIKWEKSGDDPTKMSWSVEKDVRLATMHHHFPEEAAAFVRTYAALTREPAARRRKVKVTAGAAGLTLAS